MALAQVNVYEAKTHLSRLLRRVRAGEEIVIAEAGTPVARLVPLERSVEPRVLGNDRGKIWLSDDFDAPLSDDVLSTFYDSPIDPEQVERRPSVAKRKRRRLK